MQISDLIQKISLSIAFFQQSVVRVLTRFKIFWYTYIWFDQNPRTVVLASIQMLLGQQGVDIAYFWLCHFYVNSLPIMEI